MRQSFVPHLKIGSPPDSPPVSNCAARLLAGLALACSLGNVQANDSMVVVGYGGAGQKALSDAFFKPFAKASGAPLTEGEYNGEMARIKVMVDTGSVDWDLVEIEAPDLVRGCEEGMFERLDWQRIDGADQLIADAAQECGSATMVWSVALAYDAGKLAEAPKSWADFWDVQRFPGKRGLRKRAVYNLEFALLADGVRREDVYKVLATPAGVERAFAKLDQLKPHIQWWEAGAQPVQWLAAGDVTMTSVYSGRIAAAHQEGNNFAVVWPDSLYGMDYWAIIKGSKHVDRAHQLIAFINKADNQADYVKRIPYGPVNQQTFDRLDPALTGWLPSAPENMEQALAMDVEFWTDHGEDLEQRFNAWAAKK
ncbi:ABC transporter substrate-binding protein [Pseudomonas sp. TCU-HL1]|uniref:ABC transporter substrate-binding protein n=1 Tax=Pseudomonas sp. TCU-HL1 TaxID=1856685 RepID=UPI0008586693|nr:ABC transporter substrate-binding protein [Pseudomonas sp. TCU-HL1]AOE87788.1 spermidine/putrescine ABC transporter substrate-binding protein [Pseudomonas sp. TCU-HL1]